MPRTPYALVLLTSLLGVAPDAAAQRWANDTFEQATRFMDMGISGAVQNRLRDLGQLLDSLSETLGRAFESEVARLHKRLEQLTENTNTRQRMHEWLEARASPVATN